LPSCAYRPTSSFLCIDADRGWPFSSVKVLIKQIRDYIKHRNAGEILVKARAIHSDVKKLADNNVK
jgi:hypothetical protein